MAEVKLNIIVDAKGNIKAVDDAGRAMNDAETKALGLEQQLERVRQAKERVSLAAAAMSAAVVAGFAAAAHAAADYGDELAKASDKTGVSVGDLARLRYAAEQSGVEFGSLQMALARMSRSAQQAAKGTGETAEVYARLGVSVHDANGQLRGGQALFRDLAQSLVNIESPTERTALAMGVFGRAGMQLLPMFKDGSVGIDELTARAEKLGLVIDEDAARAAERFNDALNDIKLAAKGTTVAIGETAFGSAEYAERVAEVIGSLTQWIRDNERLVRGMVGVTVALGGVVSTMYAANKAFGLAKESVAAVRTVMALYRGVILKKTVAIDAETAALGRNTAAQVQNAAAARGGGAARTGAMATRGAGMLGGGLGAAGTGLAGLGSAAAAAAVPLAIIATSAVAIALWKRNFDVLAETIQTTDDGFDNMNKNLELMGEEVKTASASFSDWIISLSSFGILGKPSTIAKQRRMEEQAAESVMRVENGKVVWNEGTAFARRAEGGESHAERRRRLGGADAAAAVGAEGQAAAAGQAILAQNLPAQVQAAAMAPAAGGQSAAVGAMPAGAMVIEGRMEVVFSGLDKLSREVANSAQVRSSTFRAVRENQKRGW